MADFFSVYGLTSARCSCGMSLKNCEFWGTVARDLSHRGLSVQDFPYFSRIQKKCEAHWTRGGSLFPAKYYSHYMEFMQPFFTAVSALLGSECKAIVDSSKTSYLRENRPTTICKLAKYRVRVVHLVRDCRGVVWSVKKGLNRKLETGDKNKVFMPAARAAAGWVHANRAASRLKRHLGENNYCLFRYEDLVHDPVGVLEEIADRWDINLDESICAAKVAAQGSELELPGLHQLAGNRMRFRKTFCIRPDYTWREQLHPGTSALVKNIVLPWMKKYGYV